MKVKITQSIPVLFFLAGSKHLEGATIKKEQQLFGDGLKIKTAGIYSGLIMLN